MDDFDQRIHLLEHLPGALVKVRADLGLKSVRAVELARSHGCGVNAATLSHWENGNKTPTLPPLLCYLAALGKSLCDLHRAMVWASGGEPEPEPLEVALEGKADTPEVTAFAERTDFDNLRERVEELEDLRHRLEELEFAILEQSQGDEPS